MAVIFVTNCVWLSLEMDSCTHTSCNVKDYREKNIEKNGMWDGVLLVRSGIGGCLGVKQWLPDFGNDLLS